MKPLCRNVSRRSRGSFAARNEFFLPRPVFICFSNQSYHAVTRTNQLKHPFYNLKRPKSRLKNFFLVFTQCCCRYFARPSKIFCQVGSQLICLATIRCKLINSRRSPLLINDRCKQTLAKTFS